MKSKLLIVLVAASVHIDLFGQSLDSLESTFQTRVLPLISKLDKLNELKVVINRDFHGPNRGYFVTRTREEYYKKYLLPVIGSNMSWEAIEDFINIKTAHDPLCLAWASDYIFTARLQSKLLRNQDFDSAKKVVANQKDGNPKLFYYRLISFFKDQMSRGKYKYGELNFAKSVDFYISEYPSEIMADHLNDWAWAVFEKCSDAGVLQQAEAWALKATKLAPDSGQYLDTYANLLYKMGKTSIAIKVEEKAIELTNGKDEEIKGNLEKMKAGVNTW